MQEEHPQNQENSAPSQETSAAPPVHTRYDRNTNGTNGCLVFLLIIAAMILLLPVVFFGFCMLMSVNDTKSQLIGLGILVIVAIIVWSVFVSLR